MSPNVLGHVVELDESRRNAAGELDLEGTLEIRLKLRLQNTLGKVLEVWVAAPAEVANFYSSDIPAQEV